MEQIILTALGLTALVVGLLLITAFAAVALLTFVFAPFEDEPFGWSTDEDDNR